MRLIVADRRDQIGTQIEQRFQIDAGAAPDFGDCTRRDLLAHRRRIHAVAGAHGDQPIQGIQTFQVRQVGCRQDGDGTDRNLNDLRVREAFGDRRPTLDQQVTERLLGVGPGGRHRDDLVMPEILQGEALGVGQRGFVREVVDLGIVAVQAAGGQIGRRRNRRWPGMARIQRQQPDQPSKHDRQPPFQGLGLLGSLLAVRIHHPFNLDRGA
ncbi:MAG: hypothetical protein U5O69_04375 [Candidatus Competibacteraceae bacterium]|nr:hypothetical protein [Candidatus Competibacteraceae bacterium]